MFNIEIDDVVQFRVKGAMNTKDGVAKPFDFGLKCKRLDTDEFKAATNAEDGEVTMADFMVRVTRDWLDVRDGSGKPVDFSEEALRTLCKVPGLASLMFRTYGIEAGAKEKN